MTKQPIAYDICESYYYQYLRNPCERNRQLLKDAYEKVPEHERCYLGDMDTLDSDFRRIIYHPEVKYPIRKFHLHMLLSVQVQYFVFYQKNKKPMYFFHPM